MTTIAPDVLTLTNTIASQTGENIDVVDAQLYAENNANIDGTNEWQNNNPFNIRPGNPYVDQLANGTNNGFLTFASPQAGAQAYATLISNDPNYSGVRAAIASHSPGAELAAIAASPYDTNHYTAHGVVGDSLYSAYNAVKGDATTNIPTATTSNTYTISNPGNSMNEGLNTFPDTQPTTVLGTVTGVNPVNQSGSSSSGFGLNLGLLGNIGINVIVVLVGIILAAVMLYKLITG